MKLRLPVRLLAAVVAAVSHVTFLTIASASGAWAVGENDDLLITDSSFVADGWPSSAQQNADATLSDKEAEALGQAEAGLPEELEAMGSLEVTTPLTEEKVAAVSAAPAVASVGGANTTENVTGAKLLAEEAALVAEYNAIMPGAEGTETPAVTYSANNAAATQTAAAANLTVPETTVNSYKATSDALSAVSDSFSASVNPQPSAPTTETVSGSTGVAVSSPAASAPVFLMTGDVGAPSVLLTTAVGPTLHETTFIGNWMAIGDSISHGTHAYSYRWGLQKIFIDNGIGYDAIGVQKTSFWGDYDSASYGGGKFDNEHCAQFNVWASEVSGNAVAEYIYYSEQYSEQSLWYSNVKNWLGLSNELTGGNGDYSPSEHGDRFTTFTGETAPDTYTIMLGTNDLNKGRSNSDILADVAVILNAAQERAANDGNATVYVMSVPYARGTLSAEKISSYNTELQTWITKNKANYANLDIRYVNINDGLYDVTGTSGGGAVASMMQDWAHPTAQGDLIIAGNLAKGMGYAGRTAGQTRKAAADFAQGTYAGGFSALPTTGLTNVTLNGTGLDFSAANATASFNWDSTPTGGYTVDFSLALGNGSSGGWDTTNNFSITLGDGSLYGTLNVNEAYIKWGDTILYSRDAQTAANLRVAYVQADAANSLASGYYVWLDDQLIGEACGTSPGSAYNGVTFSYSGTGNALLSSLAMDSTNSWAPTSTLTTTDEGYHVYNASDFRISEAKGLSDFSNANAGAAVTVIVSGKRLGTYNNVAYYYANYANDSANVGSCTTWSFTDGNTKAGYASYGLGNRTADVTARLTGACPGFKELYGALYHNAAATLTGNIHTQLDAELASYGFYYGSKNMTVNGTVALTANEGTITGNVVGGFGAITTGAPSIGVAEVYINNHAVVQGNVYGGSIANGTVGSTKVEITGGRVEGDVYGGGTAGTVTGDTQVYITGGEILGSVHGGGNGDTINGKDSVVVESHIPHIAGSIEATTVSIGNLHDGPSYDPDGFDKYKGTITAGGTITFTDVDSSNFAPTVIAQNVWLLQSDVHIKSLTLTACTITMADDESTLTIDEKLVLGGVATYEGAGNLVIADNAQIDVSGLDLAGLAGAGSTVNLITTTGTGTLSTGDNLSFKFAEGFDPGNYSWSASGNNLVLSLNVPEGTDLIWNGSNGTWNTFDALWHKDGSSENTVFTANADVRFDAASNGSTVTLGEAITAGTMTIDSGVAVTIKPNSKTLSATLQGAGTYVLPTAQKTLPTGVILGEDWIGKVRLSGTGFTDLLFQNVAVGSNGLATSKSAIELRGVTGWMRVATHDANLILVDDEQTSALTIDNGSSGSTTTLSGKITGSGTLKHNWGKGACTFVLTGDLSEWKGSFVKSAGNTTTLALKDNTNTTIAAGAQNAGNGTLNVNINNSNAVTLSGEFSKTAGTLNVNVGNEKATNATFTGAIDGAKLTVSSGSSVLYNGENAVTLQGLVIDGNQGGSAEFTRKVTITGNDTLTVDNNEVVKLNGGFDFTGTGGGYGYAAIVNSGGRLVIGGEVDMSSKLLASGSGGEIVFASGANANLKGVYYSTATLVNNGTVTVESGATVNLSTSVDATTLNNSGNLTANSGAWVGTLNAGGGKLTLGNNSTITTVNGQAADSAEIRIASGKTLTVTTLNVEQNKSLTLDGDGSNAITNVTSQGSLTIRNNTNVTGAFEMYGPGTGTTTIEGGVTTVGGAFYMGNNGGNGASGAVLNVGTDDSTATLVVNRLEVGDMQGGTEMQVNVHGGSKLVVTGNTNTGDYKAVSVVLGELTTNGRLTVAGDFYAKDANLQNGNYSLFLDVNNGGTVAAYSIGGNSKGNYLDVTLNNGGTLVLGAGGIVATRKFDAKGGEVGMSAATTTLAGAISLAADTDTKFNTAQYTWDGTNANQTLQEGTVGGAMTVSGVISGSGALTKKGAGILKLSAANTFTGDLVVSNGTLELGNAQALGAVNGGMSSKTERTIRIDSGAAIDLRGQDDRTYVYTLNGGTLQNTGAATNTNHAQTAGLILTADSSVGGTGAFYILNNDYKAATVNMKGDGAASGHILTKKGSNTIGLYSTSFTNGGTIKVDDGVLNFTKNGYGDGTVSSDIVINREGDGVSGQFILNGSTSVSSTHVGAKISANMLLQGATTVNAGTAQDLTLSGMLSNEGSNQGSITKTGTGTVTLSGDNTYSGGTTVEYGTLVAASANALGSGAITVNNGGTLVFSDLITTTGNLTVNEGGTLSFGGIEKLTTGILTLGSGSVLNLSQLKFSDDEGTIILAKTTGGVLGTLKDVVLNGASGFSYTLRLDDENSNYLVLAYENNIKTRIWDNDSGNNLWTTSDANWHPTNNVTSHTGFNALDRAVFNNDATVTLNGEVLASSLTINNSKSVVLNMNANNFTIAEKVEGTGASLTFKGTDNDAEVANIAGGVSLKNLTVDGAHAVTVGGHVEVADKLTVKDAKLMEISGSTSANAIELENVDAANFQGKVASATTKITDSSMTLGADSGLGRLTLDNSTLTLTSNHAVILSETVDMQVSGSSSITGTGSITTTGMNLADGSTLSIAGGQTIHVTTEHGVTGNGTLSLGDVTLNAEMRSWSLAEDVAVSLTDATNGTKLSAVNHTLTVDSNMTGAGKLVKTGGGTVELTGTNSYRGGTEVNAGKLLISSAGALTGDVTVANGGTLSISDTLSSAATVGDLTVNQGGTLLLGGENRLKVGGTLTFGPGAALDLFNLDIVVDQKQYTLASGGTFTGYEGISLTFAPGIHAADGTTPSLTVTGEEGNQTLVLNYTLNTPHDLIWDGGTANWNNDTALWHAKNAGAASSTFATYDNVIFDGTDIAGREGNDRPTLSENVYATRMTVTEGNNVTIDTNGYRLDVDFLQAGEGSTVTKDGNGNAYIGIADSGFAGNVEVLGGTLTLQYMDLKGKGLEIDGNLTRTGGTLNVVVGLEEAPSDVTLTGEVSGLASLLARQDSTVTFTKNVTMDSSVNTRITAEDGAVITFKAGANMTQRNWTIDGAGVVNIKGDTRFTQTNSTTELIGGTVTANFEHLISTTREVNLKVEKGTTLNIDKLTLDGTERFYIDFQYTGDQQVDRQDVHIGNLEIKTNSGFSGIGINNTQVQELRAYQQNGSYYVDRVTGSGMAAFFNYGAPQGAASGCQPTDGGWWVPQVFYVGGASVEDDDLFTGEIRLTDTYTNQVRPGQADRHKNTVVVLEDEMVASRSVITVSNWGNYSDFGLGIDAETVKTQGFNDVHFIDTNRFTVYSGTIGEEVNATYGSDDTVRTLQLTGKTNDTASTTYSSSAGFDKNVNIVKEGAGKQTFKGDSSAFNADINVQGGVLEFLNNTSLHIEDLTLAGNAKGSTANNLAIRKDAAGAVVGTADVFGTAKVYDGSAINANMTMEGGSVLDVSNAVTKVQQGHSGVDARVHDDYTGGLNLMENNLTLHSGISLSDTDVRNLFNMGWGDTYALAYNVDSFTLGGTTYEDALGWSGKAIDGKFVVTGTEASKYLANLQLDDYFICYSGNSKAEGDTIDAHVVYIVKVPEPATTTLSLLALAALCARRRRK